MPVLIALLNQCGGAKTRINASSHRFLLFKELFAFRLTILLVLLLLELAHETQHLDLPLDHYEDFVGHAAVFEQHGRWFKLPNRKLLLHLLLLLLRAASHADLGWKGLEKFGGGPETAGRWLDEAHKYFGLDTIDNSFRFQGSD